MKRKAPTHDSRCIANGCPHLGTLSAGAYRGWLCRSHHNQPASSWPLITERLIYQRKVAQIVNS
jgi:hypothetical protein